MAWIKNTFYTALFCGVVGATASSQSDMFSEAYETDLKSEVTVLEKYKGKHGLEEELERVREEHEKFEDGNGWYRAGQMIINPKRSYQSARDHSKFDFKSLASRKSLNGLKFGALGGLGLRVLFGIKGIAKKKKSKKRN